MCAQFLLKQRISPLKLSTQNLLWCHTCHVHISAYLVWFPLSSFSTAVTGEISFFTVREGDGVTLPCEHVIEDQVKCDATDWFFRPPRHITAVELVTRGRIGEAAKSKSDRLSVTEKCSLVIKKVTAEDVGRYDCQQYKPGQIQYQDTLVYLSVVTSEYLHHNVFGSNCLVTTRY